MTTFEDLYRYLSSKDIDVNAFLKDKWGGAEMQESMLRLFAYLGIIDELSAFTPCSGNFSMKTIQPIKTADYRLLFQKALKDKGDVSDLTMIRGSDILATTSKNLKTYCVGDLDIDRIYNIFNDSYQNYTLVLCIVIPDKKEFYRVVSRAELTSANLVDKCSRAIILDHGDLVECFVKFRNEFVGRELPEFYSARRSMNLYFHQQMAVDKFLSLNEDKTLLGCIPRSGKSYIVAGIIASLKKGNFLLMTTCPSETIAQLLKYPSIRR